MSVNTNTKVNVKGATRLSPKQIFADHSKNISRFNASDEFQGDEFYLKNLAFQMFRDGNLEPVSVAKLAVGDVKDGVYYELWKGFNRWLAAMMIVDGFDYLDPDSGETIHIYNPNFVLQVVLADGNSVDRFRYNVTDNFTRKAPSPMDIAWVIRQGEQLEGMKTRELADLLQLDKTAISQFRKLLNAPIDIQNMLSLSPANKGSKKKLSWRTVAKIVDSKSESQVFWFNKIRAGEKFTIEDVWMRDFGGTAGTRMDEEDIYEVLFGDIHASVYGGKASVESDEEPETDRGKPSEDATPVAATPVAATPVAATPVVPEAPKVQMTPKMMADAFRKLDSPHVAGPVRLLSRDMINRFLNNKDYTEEKFYLAVTKVMSETIKLTYQDLVTEGTIQEMPNAKVLKGIGKRIILSSLIVEEERL